MGDSEMRREKELRVGCADKLQLKGVTGRRNHSCPKSNSSVNSAAETKNCESKLTDRLVAGLDPLSLLRLDSAGVLHLYLFPVI